MRIYLNKIENRTTFKFKTGYYLELLTLETMKLLGNTTSEITKDENVENFPRLEIAEVVLVHFKFVNNYHHYLRVLYIFTPNKYFGQLLDIFQKVKIS